MNTQWGVKVKLLGSLGLVALMALGGSIYMIGSTRHLRNATIRDLISGAQRLDQSRKITIDVANMRSNMRGLSLFSLSQNAAQVDKVRKSFDAAGADLKSVLQAIEAEQLSSDERSAVTRIRSGVDQWLAGFQEYARLTTGGNAAEGDAFALKNLTPLMDSIQKETSELGRLSRVRQDAATDQAFGSMRTSETLNWIVALTVLLASFISLVVVRNLVQSLRQVASSVGAGAHEVMAAADQVSSASQSLAQGSSEQAASLEETSAATQEINSMAKRNTENAETSVKIVTESGLKFEEANRALDQMVSASNEIDASSGKISQIIKVIDEIAFQTNILALNAAVEAARAGEAGMGFAVVADEVRNLAQRSSQAAKDTASLIEESIHKSRGGKTIVGQVSSALRTITEEAGKVKILVEEVNLGSREQARGIEEVGRSITQMEQVTQKTAAEAEESAAAAEQLKAQSHSMSAIADRLTTLVDGA